MKVLIGVPGKSLIVGDLTAEEFRHLERGLRFALEGAWIPDPEREAVRSLSDGLSSVAANGQYELALPLAETPGPR